MANFRTTADYLDSILLLAGETTNGNSAFETRALHYLNRIHNSIIQGGNEFNVEVDEVWPWSLSPDPIIIDLKPKYTTGTVALTNGSTTLTFSSAPTISLAGYHLKLDGNDNYYKIVSHSANTTTGTIEAAFEATSVTANNYKAIKLDYELIPAHFNITSVNNKITFTETTVGTELTASLTVKSYASAADLITEIQTQMDSAGASTYTVTYNSVTRKFTITSDLSGGDNLFSLLGATGTESSIYASAFETLGLGLKDHTGAAAYTSERPIGSICKLIQPFKLDTGYNETAEIYGVDKIRFSSDYPISTVVEGNPTRFAIIEERDDGYIKVRFNKYVESEKRIEIHYVPTPLDLYDNAKSHPLIPRKHSLVLEYGGAAYLMAEKNDGRAQQYFQLAGSLLEAMMRNNRKNSERVGKYFGEIIARPDLMSSTRKRLMYGTPEEN